MAAPVPDASTAAGPARDTPPAGTSAISIWREGGRPLVALLAVALLIKLLVVAAALDADPHLEHPRSDSRYYLDRAAGLAGLTDDPKADEAYHLPPLYPLVLSAVPGAAEGHVGGVLLLQALAGVGLLALVYAFARGRTSRDGALIATGLTLLYGPLTFFETRLLGDSLATGLLIAALVACDRLAARPTGWRGAVVGALLGTACLLRPQVLLLVPLLALWGARRGRRAGLAVAAVAALCLVPSTWHNLQATGDLIPVSDNGGINLWLAASGPPSGTFRTDDRAFGDIDTQAQEARRRAETAEGRSLSAGEVSAHFRDAALRRWRDDPVDQLRRVGLRALALLETFETGVVTIPPVESSLLPPLRVLALPFGVLLALAGAGAVLLAGGPPEGRAPWFPAVALTVVVSLTALLFFHYSRFRLPLVPLLAVVGGCTVESLRRRRPGVGRVLVAALVAASLAAVSWWPAGHHANTLANGWTSLADARRAGSGPGDPSGLRRARGDVERALQADPGFVRAWLLAAELDLALGDLEGADRWLDRLEPLLPDDPQVLAARGILSLLPHPSNRFVDVPRGRACRDALLRLSADDPSLRALVATLDGLLARHDGG